MASAANPEVRPEGEREFLRSCLVEGDPAQEKHVRRNKQRSLFASVALQILVVAALIAVPLFSKGENIASRAIVTPLPPYGRGGSHQNRNQAEGPHEHGRPRTGYFFDHLTIGIASHPSAPSWQDSDQDRDDSGIGQFGDPHRDPRGFLNFDSTRGPKPPDEDIAAFKHGPVRRQVSGLVQAAKLILRVEPEYPRLAIMTRREGRVELHAIIATDGTVQSLEC